MSENFDRIDSGYDETPEGELPRERVQPEKPETAMDALRAGLAKSARRPNYDTPIKSRPGFSIRFDPNIEFEMLKAWGRRAERRLPGNKTDQDSLALAVSVVWNTAVALLVNGQEAYDDEGKIMNVRSVAVAQMLGVESTSPKEVLRALFGSDGIIMTVSQEVLQAAGYDADVDLSEDGESPTT